MKGVMERYYMRSISRVNSFQSWDEGNRSKTEKTVFPKWQMVI